MPRDVTSQSAPSAPRSLDTVRALANQELDPERKSALGQFMTPSSVATFMAELFTGWDHPAVQLLDAGAGVGSLTAAFLDAWLTRSPRSAHASTVAYEVDQVMRGFLASTLTHYERAASAHGRTLSTKSTDQDFIAAGTQDAMLGLGPRFTHAILNPPYKKIGSNSPTRRLLRDAGIETVNLYTGFLAVALALLEDRGELVAIVPRSFCNGAYYRPFREWMRQRAALTHLHLFERRDHAFKDDDVLQENIIVKWVRGAPQSDVTVSWCRDADFSDLQRRCLPFSMIVKPDDSEGFIHIPTQTGPTEGISSLFSCSLEEIGLSVSTGPVVDFRLKEHLRQQPEQGTVPLLYPQHFAGGGLRYPGTGKKPSALVFNDDTRRWLLPNGWYVVTKRFTSKEERRRVVAHVIDPAVLPSEWIGLENHINVFHFAKAGLEPELAHGLALFLNSTAVDEHFRVFSGHTQVNATDLRNMRYPSRSVLKRLGRWARACGPLTQEEIDVRLTQQT